ncbi:hypothetical protein NSK_005156 [Nannochloropsis salina CCMP1776]|uniref:General transcription and DNA repair factor IIH subunit TFB5 n=1 Tax=Nannochloropsis salina CCMP1776 TaxID=1027361 RepID=A0A4D9CZD8_9STRA|nr:hypothetical protein NSK_005156 [Nannochloropsis salina CCMP1776]|eukprot:TFJ83547.1 hypothetical protein NSK_005156 [Nannochloropsis salina CCMP1776]
MTGKGGCDHELFSRGKRGMFTRKGVLVTCDVPMKQLIKHLDPGNRAIIQDLDETHLFVDANAVSTIKREIESFVDKHVYAPTPDEQARSGKPGR